MHDFFRQIYRKIIEKLPTKLVLHIENFRGYHKLVNFKNPKYFGEKIQWLKLNGNLEKYSDYVDKYKVREFIKKEIGEEYLIPLLGVYEKAEDIDYSKLPDRFVLKINNGSGYNIVVKNKTELNIDKTNKQLNKWLKEDYAKMKKEPQYKNVRRKIIIEKYTADKDGKLNDYKFFCFNGKVKMFKVDFDRFLDHKCNYYDENCKFLNINEGNYNNDKNAIILPNNIKEMINIAEKISTNFNFVRVDLYNVEGKIYFGELTFTPAAGINPFKPLEKDLEIAKKIDIRDIDFKIPEKKANKILYIGSLGYKRGRTDGVTIKARNLLNYMVDNNINVITVDVDNYKKKFMTISYKILKSYRSTDKIVICTSSPGAAIFLHFLRIINNKKDVFYFVSGGILGKWIESGKYKINNYKKIKKIYVESSEMLNDFLKLGLKQTVHINNFRITNFTIAEKRKNVDYKNIKLVFFARIVKEKGVEDAINVVKRLIDSGYNVLLDIYGQADKTYLKRINELIKDYKKINYCNSIIPDGMTEYSILSNYDVFLFPTKYETEGLPGSLIDAYISGLAVIASNWRFANEYIGENGVVYDFNDINDFYKKLKEIIDNKSIDYLKIKALKESKKYLAENNLNVFLKDLEEK